MTFFNRGEKSPKEITEAVVLQAVAEITAFQTVLQTFLEQNTLSQKIPVHQAFESATELLSLVGALRKYINRYKEEYNLHLVTYPTSQKLEQFYTEAKTFHQLLGLSKSLNEGVDAPSPIEASDVAEYVWDKVAANEKSSNSSDVKCNLCKKHTNTPTPVDRKNQYTCSTVNVKHRYRNKRK